MAILLFSCTKPPKPEEVMRDRVSQFRGTVNEVVTDAHRVRDINLRIDKMVVLGRDYLESNRAFAAELRKLNLDYEAKREQFKDVFIRFENGRKRVRADFMRLHFEIVFLTTPAEWEKIAQREIKVLEVSGPLYGIEEKDIK